MNIALILAAGNSNRYNGEKPKQFEYLNDKMVLEYSVNTFIEHSEIEEVILVVHNDYLQKIKKIIKNCKIISGGKRRQDSSLMGLMACPKNTENVLIHDAARPFVSKKIIDDCLIELKHNVAVCPALSFTDTIAEVDPDKNISKMLNRNILFGLQTPQAFKYKTILDCHKKLEKNVTDDISVIKEFNYNCKIIEGCHKNMKITFKDDLKKINLLL